MSKPSWERQITQRIHQAGRPRVLRRLSIIGVGHELRGDDAVGPHIVHALLTHAANWPLSSQIQILDGGSAPENCTGAIRRFGPDTVLLIDAVLIGQEPGIVACIDLPAAWGFDATTHGLSLDLLGQFLQGEFHCQVMLLAIQVKSMELGAPLTPEVRACADEVVNTFDKLARAGALVTDPR